MFGIRRSNVSYKRNSDGTANANIENTENIIPTTEEEQEDIYKSTKFIFYDDKKKFTNQLEIYISLTNYNNKKLLVIIGNDSSIEELNNQIIVSLGSFPEFKNINCVKAEGIYKISNDNKIVLPEEGKVSDYVNSGDILYCNLITDEYWIKTYFNIQTLNFKKIIKLEYKLKKKMRYKRFKLMLMKGGIQLFIENIKSLKFYNSFNYYIKLFEFKIKKHKKVITHNIHNKQKDKKTIDKIINFSSEIIVILKFGLFEKLIHRNIKITKLKYRKNIRVDEYNDLSFEELINDKKFLPEFTAIKELTEEFLKEQYDKNNPKFLFFSKKKAKNSVSDFFSKKSKSKYIDDDKPINEENDEYVEDKEDSKLGGLNENLNINQINTKRKSTFNSLDSIDTCKLTNENEEKKEKKKKKSLFFKNDDDKKELELEIPKKEKKEKKEIIKNMIIIASFIIKEEKKKEKLFFRKITCKNFENNLEFRKNIPSSKNSKFSFSNKNISNFESKKLNFDIDEDVEDEKETNYNINNFEKDKEDNEDINLYTSIIELETKPKTFSDKNIIKNNLLFRSFNDEKSKDGLDELFLDIQEEDENEKEKGNINLLKNNKYNNNLRLNSFDNNDESSSNLEEYDEDFKNSHSKKNIRQTFERRSTYVSEKKLSIFSALRNKNPPNFYQEIKSNFKYDIFLDRINNLFNNSSNKKMLDKIKMPQSKDIEYLEKEYKFLIETKRRRQFEELQFSTGEYHIYIFMSVLFIFSGMIILCLNLDLMSIFY